MSVNDPLGDLFTRIRNAQTRGHEKVESPASTLRAAVLEVLKGKGYIRDFKTVDQENGSKNHVIDLKYYEGSPVIQKIQRVSKPGRRVYSSVSDLKPAHNGLGIYILSTPKGVMSDYDARDNNVGGEVLGSVY